MDFLNKKIYRTLILEKLFILKIQQLLNAIRLILLKR
jgi:hypothetical protein